MKRDALPELLLIERKVEALFVTMAETDRPLRGTAGRADWRLGGILSQWIKSGQLTGREDECVYVPIDVVPPLHIIVVGVGAARKRSAGSLKLAARVAKNLKLKSIAFSEADFGEPSDDVITKSFAGIEVCVTP